MSNYNNYSNSNNNQNNNNQNNFQQKQYSLEDNVKSIMFDLKRLVKLMESYFSEPHN